MLALPSEASIWRKARLHLAACLACLPVLASAASVDMLDVARLWRDVQYLHPALSDESIDWDRALVKALPSLLAARDKPGLKTALEQMMRPLNDPGLRIWDEIDNQMLEWPDDKPLFERMRDGVGLLHLHAGRKVEQAAWQAALASVNSRPALVVDLRATSRHMVDLNPYLEQLAAHFISAPLPLPAEQYRFQTGMPAFGEPADPTMPAGLMTLATHSIKPAPGARRRPVVFLVNGLTAVPKTALALQRQGVARIVATSGTLATYAAPLMQRRVGDGLMVEFSRARLVAREGLLGYRPDRIAPDDGDTGIASAAVKAAAAMLSATPRRRAQAVPVPLPVQRQQAYDQGQFPSKAMRILAAIKLWATIERQYPARDLLGSSWDEALLACIQRMATVEDNLQYAQALQAMLVHLGDNHAWVWSRALSAHRGKADLPLSLAVIENKVIVIGADAAHPESGALAAGDEVLAIDGEPVASMMDRLRPQISSATGSGMVHAVLRRLLSGAPDSLARLTVSGPDGARQVEIRRRILDEELVQRPAGAAMRYLGNDLAYVDLDRLQQAEVPAMFAFIAGRRGVIFDLRGYPHGTAWDIARRLNVKHAAFGPGIHAPFASGLPAPAPQRLSYAQPLRAPDGPLFTGKVAVLIDSRTMSQSEHTVQMFESAAPITLIGSRSVGTNGDLRHLVLPGKVTVSFSGLEITHADGRRMQQAGIAPHLEVRPTVAGVRAGRDEVLERAERFLREDG
ncbi:S41 family peptidase [Pseudoduganella violaceinigra]|uniref:S41 family peptidase n=1 Tax=Pseudoduganella violaceinigra TaxID=246602 RepID=UPI00048501DB|nr:S41 family peptidase [Pseudoduganella violaceinigra]